MPVEFKTVEVARDLETGLYFVTSRGPAYRHLVCEARTISALHKKVARALDTTTSAVELRLGATLRSAPAVKKRRSAR
jgi:hypothetical protein